jgi:3',5'-cyclic AMP phosphodiesterase CpdA
MRFAHLTDTHVQPELRAGEGFAAALRSLDDLNPHPRFIVTGGDHVMDAFEQEARRCVVQWDLYQRVLRDHTDIPVRAVIGNHDVAGWGALEKFTPETDGYGKAMCLQRLGLSAPYSSFDAGGWHFVLLDSVARRQHSYFGELGEEQTEWLKRDLESLSPTMPVCMVSHLPVLSVCVFVDGKRLKPNSTHWDVPDSFMHRDMPAIVSLIERHNVKLLLSGHIHIVDRCQYRGKTYICDGAVSGNWWKGSYNGCPEGYGIIDVWPDGSFEHQYVTFGWRADTSG